MSIAVEATLRDVLSTRGYTFVQSANRANVYRYARARLDGAGKRVHLDNYRSRTSASRELGLPGIVLPIDIGVKREEKPNSEGLI